MNAVTPVTITTPDNVERELRFTFGARKRISDIFGCDLMAALNKYDSGAFPGVLFALMHDANGNPPSVTEAWLSENLPIEAANEILAAIMSAATQGKTEKKYIEALLIAKQQGTTGSTTGPSALSVSESATANSGGDTSNAKSKPESEPTPESKDPGESSLETSP